MTAIVMPTSTVSALTAPSIRKNGSFLFSPFPPSPPFVYPATSKGAGETYFFFFPIFNHTLQHWHIPFFSLFGRKTLARPKIRIQTASRPKLLQRPSSRAQSSGSNEIERKGNERGEGSWSTGKYVYKFYLYHTYIPIPIFIFISYNFPSPLISPSPSYTQTLQKTLAPSPPHYPPPPFYRKARRSREKNIWDFLHTHTHTKKSLDY